MKSGKDMEREVLKKPFIKKFRTDKYNYIYDVNSNELLRVNHIIYDIIDLIEFDIKEVLNKFKHKYTINEICKNYKIIRKAKESNFYSSSRPEISSGIESENDVRNLLESGLKQLILDITTGCNLRCRYCTFSGRYYYSRQHENRSMSFNVARKAVEFFIEKTGNVQKDIPPAITFYGGEPLLRFNLIKRIVELIKVYKVNCQYIISLTTNGTLLSHEIIEYFVKNDISILISLDGPKEIHDRYRVFKNGKGTFDIIMKNIKLIKKFSEEYFLNKISFSSVISPPYNFDLIIDFFFKNKFFSPIKDKVRIDFVDSYETTFFKDFHLEEHGKKIHDELNRLLNRYKRALINDNYEQLTIEKRLFLEDFYTIVSRSRGGIGEKYPPLGTCIPGKRRLLVSTDGKFFMCEKVYKNYEIGNIDDGFDFERIYRFYKDYDDFFKECKYCWALRLCKKCFNDIKRGEDLDENRKKNLCENLLKNIEGNLITFCEIIERNPAAFKIFQGIKVN